MERLTMNNKEPMQALHFSNHHLNQRGPSLSLLLNISFLKFGRIARVTPLTDPSSAHFLCLVFRIYLFPLEVTSFLLFLKEKKELMNHKTYSVVMCKYLLTATFTCQQ